MFYWIKLYGIFPLNKFLLFPFQNVYIHIPYLGSTTDFVQFNL